MAPKKKTSFGQLTPSPEKKPKMYSIYKTPKRKNRIINPKTPKQQKRKQLYDKLRDKRLQKEGVKLHSIPKLKESPKKTPKLGPEYENSYESTYRPPSKRSHSENARLIRYLHDYKQSREKTPSPRASKIIRRRLLHRIKTDGGFMEGGMPHYPLSREDIQ